jgi:HK97 family phage portal protein
VILRSLLESRSSDVALSNLGSPSSWLAGILGGLPSEAGVPVSERNAIGLSAVWTCVNIRAGLLASLPLKVYQRMPDGGRRLARETREYKLLHDRPSLEDTSYNFRHKLSGNKLLWGNGYAQIETDGRGMLKNLWPYHPSQVRVSYGSSRGDFHYIVTGQVGGDFVQQKVMPGDMLHFRGFCHEGIEGLSVIQNYRRGLGLAAATEIFASNFYKNGARASGVLMYPKKLQEGSKDRLADSFDSKHTGTSNAGRTIVLEEGATYQPLSVPQNDAQFIETRRMSRAEIAGLYGIPTMLLPGSDDKAATYASSETFNRQLVDYTLRDDLTMWQNELNSKLFANSDFYCEFDLRDLLRGDTAARAQYWKARWETASINANEIREDENENPIEGGDKYYYPLNYGVVGEPVPAVPSTNKPTSTPDPAVNGSESKSIAKGYKKLFSNVISEIKSWDTFTAKRASAKLRGLVLEPIAADVEGEIPVEKLSACADALALRAKALSEEQFDAELEQLVTQIRSAVVTEAR